MKWYKNPVIVIAYLAVCLIVIVNLVRSNIELYGRQGFIKKREQKLSDVKKQNLDLKKLIVETQQPDFIERQARNLLGLVKPGEIPVLIEKTEASSASKINIQKLPNWKAWWKLFF